MSGEQEEHHMESFDFEPERETNNSHAITQRYRTTAIVISVILMVAFFSAFVVVLSTKERERHFVVLVIGNGLSNSIIEYARARKGGPLAFDSYLEGSFRSSSFNHLIGDQASVGTAYACGRRTRNGFVGYGADATPCGTLLEAAKKLHWRTAIVTNGPTVNPITAAFTAHTMNQTDGCGIAKQQALTKLDLVLAGGASYYQADVAPGLCEADFLAELEHTGYRLLRNSSELLKFETKTSSKPLWGLFAPGALPYQVDRLRGPVPSPSLSEMVDSACTQLDVPREDMIMVIESANIQAALAQHDINAAYYEILELEQAWKKLKQFYDHRVHDGEDVIVVLTGSLETGGLALGGMNASGAPYSDVNAHALDDVKSSASEIASSLLMLPPPVTSAAVQSLFRSVAGSYLDSAELAILMPSAQLIEDHVQLTLAIGRVFSQRSGVTFSTTTNTMEDVPFFSIHETELVAHAAEDWELADAIAERYGFDLLALTNELRDRD